jgi:hypothetical protein
MRNLLALLLLSVLVTACGGGGGGGQTSTVSPDITPPITSVAPAVSGTTDISTNFSVTINENGYGYYLVQAATASAPTIAAMQAGTAFAMSGNVAAVKVINGLTASTTYKIYFISKDVTNNVQTTLQSVTVTTAAASLVPDVTPPITTIAPAVSGTTDTTTNLSVTISENGTGYYLVQAASATTPTITAVEAGTSFSMIANVASSHAISGLTASSSYKIYFVAKDVANNVQVALQSVAVTTVAVPLPAGYVAQGGLIWTPATFSDSWVNADAYCTFTWSNGLSGWRLPTQAELLALYSSGAMLGHGWTISATWTSTPAPYASYYLVNMTEGSSWYGNGYSAYVTCAR